MFKQIKLVWIQNFFFSSAGCLNKAKELRLFYYLLIGEGEQIGSCLSQGRREKHKQSRLGFELGPSISLQVLGFCCRPVKGSEE